MDLQAPSALLGGLSPQTFMRRHWQRRPLLVRQALPGVKPPLPRAQLFALAARDDVESRLVLREGRRWQLRHGPLARRSLPPLARRCWTLLVQGMDLHVPAAHELLSRFRFIPDARLDDLMVSWASDGGGVGPHLDSYDVFLIQVHGRRRWRIGPVADASWVGGLPVRILKRFEPEQEFVLEPGDLLYLPPRWGHDGIAEGECMTASVGFRVPTTGGIARELLQRLAEDLEDDEAMYRDPGQPATATPAALPEALARFARRALQRAVAEPGAFDRALGAVLSEPKAHVWFEGQGGAGGQLLLDDATRMLYDRRHLFVNGEAFAVGGADARLLRRLADRRMLAADDAARLSADAHQVIDDWVAAGWLHRSTA